MANMNNSETNHNKIKKNCCPSRKKLTFKTCKKNTLNSLNEVEHFLKDFNHFLKYIKLYKILK